MKISKEEFLNSLQLVRAGVSPRGLVEQSSSFVFKDGVVMTFNDEIACRKDIGVPLEGALNAEMLIASLEKFPDGQLTIRQNGDGHVEFRGKRDRFGIKLEAEVTLPIDRVETPTKWRKLPENFSDVVECVKDCAGRDETQFHLTCLHFTSEWVEACDNIHAFRWKLNLGLKGSILIRSKAMQEIIGLGVTKMSVTPAWVHFKNPVGLVLSCRQYIQEYPDITPLLKRPSGTKIEIPKGLFEANQQAALHAKDKGPGGEALVLLSIKDGRVKIRGEGSRGYYEGIRKVVYDGPQLTFITTPDLLEYVSGRYRSARISEGWLKVQGHTEGVEGTWEYITALGQPKAKKKKVVEDEGDDSDE